MKRAAYFLTLAVIVVVAIPYMIVAIFSSAGDGEEAGQDENTPVYSKNISVYMKDQGQTIELPLEEYVACVVACEMPAGFEKEALKAQAVAARTYGLARQGSLCNTVHCQVFKTKEQITAEKGDEWMAAYWDKLQATANETAGQVIYYDGELASQVMFHSSSGGRTEDSEEVFVTAVPYLRSVDSPYEDDATHRSDQKLFKISDFITTINGLGFAEVNEEDVRNMSITQRTAGGSVAILKIGENELSGKRVRKIFNLSSANFDITTDENNVIITTIGYGHGVGLSQYGANGMAKKGYNYKEILTHYYTGVEIKQAKLQ